MSQASDSFDLRYPIGRFSHRGPVPNDLLARWIDEIETLPQQMQAVVAGLTGEQLDTRYRPGGWTLRQVVHHVPDSHLNAYVRCKWALTEKAPAIKTYDEKAWAELPDIGLVPVETSLGFLSLLHAKWVTLLRALGPGHWARRFVHPEWGAKDLAWVTGLYAWHGRHHLAHITTTVEREGWKERT